MKPRKVDWDHLIEKRIAIVGKDMGMGISTRVRGPIRSFGIKRDACVFLLDWLARADSEDKNAWFVEETGTICVSLQRKITILYDLGNGTIRLISYLGEERVSQYDLFTADASLDPRIVKGLNCA